jgi:environmental stress-induced protein Ves
MAIASRPVATTYQQCSPFAFTADIDTAEKGIHSALIHSNTMKRASTAKKPAANPEHYAAAEEASSTGASRYAEVDRHIESSIEQELHEVIRGWRH